MLSPVSSPISLGGALRSVPIFSTDKVTSTETLRQQRYFDRVRKSSIAYSVNLRKIVRHIEDLVKAFDPHDQDQVLELERALRQYSGLLTPWARATAKRMLVDVMRRDDKVWKEYTLHLGVNLREQIQTAPVGQTVQELMDYQVKLITSLPLDAAKRVHELAIGSLYEGARAKEIAAEILKTGEVTRARANLIARTEVGRAQTTLTQVRAVHVGSTHYQWLTSHDRDVRPRHKRLDGSVHAWNDPPVSGERGEKAHPGCIYNCRCVAMPILPNEDTKTRTSWHASEEE